MDKRDSKENSSLPQRKQDSDVCTSLKKDECNIQCGGISTGDDGEAPINPESKKKSTCTKIYELVISLTVEPIVFCFMFAFVMNASVMSNMMMDKACLFYYNYSEEICSNLSNYDSEKKAVEAVAVNYSLFSNLTSFIAAFMMAYIAPWSDKYGRKIPLMTSMFGSILTDIGIIVCAFYFESELVYLVVARLPSEIAGGIICMFTIVFSYASEVSSERNRTLKYTAVEIALGLGVACGGLTGGFLYQYYGYTYVYVTAAALHLFGFLWVLWVLEETKGLDVTMKWHEKARDFFKCKSFKGGFLVTFRAREGKGRALLLLLMLSMCLIILNYEAFSSISYVYVHHVYNWNPTIYSIVNTTFWFVGIMFTLIMVPIFIRVFKFRDFTLGVIGVFSMMGKNLLIAFSKHHTYLFYIASSIGVFSSLGTLAVRTGISKLVDREELGRVFSFLATCEVVVPMLGTIGVTQLFNATMDIFPSITYTAGASLLILPLITFMWALKRTKNPYTELKTSVNIDTKEKV